MTRLVLLGAAALATLWLAGGIAGRGCELVILGMWLACFVWDRRARRAT